MLLSEARQRPYRTSKGERLANKADDEMRSKFSVEDEMRAKAKFAQSQQQRLLNQYDTGVYQERNKFQKTSASQHTINDASAEQFIGSVAFEFNRRAKSKYKAYVMMPKLISSFYDSFALDFSYNAIKNYDVPYVKPYITKIDVGNITVVLDNYSGKVINIEYDDALFNNYDLIYVVDKVNNGEAGKLRKKAIKEMQKCLPTYYDGDYSYAEALDEYMPEYREYVLQYVKYAFEALQKYIDDMNKRAEDAIKYVLDPANDVYSKNKVNVDTQEYADAIVNAMYSIVDYDTAKKYVDYMNDHREQYKAEFNDFKTANTPPKFAAKQLIDDISRAMRYIKFTDEELPWMPD